MTSKNKIQKLAEVTTDDLSSPPDQTLPESLFPPVARRQVENPSAPAPQLPSPGTTSRKSTDPAPQRPMITQPAQEGVRRNSNPIEGGPGSKDPGETVRAALVMAGLRATWSMNFWRVYLPEAASITSQIGNGARRRWQTGVAADASPEQWMAEINRFWKDIHPGEPSPFGGL